MKVPKYIEQAIKKHAYHNKIAAECLTTVNNWLDENGLVNEQGDGMKDFNYDALVDQGAYGIDIAEQIIKNLEEL